MTRSRSAFAAGAQALGADGGDFPLAFGGPVRLGDLRPGDRVMTNRGDLGTVLGPGAGGTRVQIRWDDGSSSNFSQPDLAVWGVTKQEATVHAQAMAQAPAGARCQWRADGVTCGRPATERLNIRGTAVDYCDEHGRQAQHLIGAFSVGSAQHMAAEEPTSCPNCGTSQRPRTVQPGWYLCPSCLYEGPWSDWLGVPFARAG